MNKRKVLVLTLLATMVFSGIAAARIAKYEEYLEGKDKWGFYNNEHNFHFSGTGVSCSDLHGTYIKPVNKDCSVQDTPGGKCYYNCSCDAIYSKTCTYPQVGSDSGCNGKYIDCQCAKEYSLSCMGVGEIGTDEGCAQSGETKYKACKCEDEYKYTAENCNGDNTLGGKVCQEKYYNECTPASGGDDDEGNGKCFIYAKFRGPLFAGQSNTDKLAKDEYKDCSPAFDAREYYPSDIVNEDDEHFGKGQWYLPSLGEVMEMVGYDWEGLESYIEKAGSDNFYQKLYAKGEGPLEALSEYMKGENAAKINRMVEELNLRGLMARGPQDNIWTSNGASDHYAYKVSEGVELSDRAGIGYVVPVTVVDVDTKVKDPNAGFLLPAAEEGSNVPEVGNLITSDLQYGGIEKFDNGNVVGIIYKVADYIGCDKTQVRVMAIDGLGDKTTWDRSKNSETCSKMDIGIPSDPFTCQDKINVCNASYMYTEDNCLAPNVLGGEECGGKYTECNEPVGVCPVPLTISPIFDGRGNTQTIVDKIGEDGYAAYACHMYYAPGVEANDANFGQGKWYLPAIGEWMDAYNMKDTIDEALSFLESGSVAGPLKADFRYWSSSEFSRDKSWALFWYPSRFGGGVSYDHKTTGDFVRAFTFLEGKFAGREKKPNVGDVMYANLTYGAAGDYDGSKTAVGVVVWVSGDGASARIINLKDLHFTASFAFNASFAFDPNNPYDNSEESAYWYKPSQFDNIVGLNHISSEDELNEQYAAGDRGSCQYYGGSEECPVPNDYYNLTGPLFDGFNNTKMMGQFSKDGDAYSIISKFYIGPKEGANISWYLPSVGEFLTMMQCNVRAFTELFKNGITDKGYADHIDEYCVMKGNLFEAWHHIFSLLKVENYAPDNMPFWLSQEVNDEKAIIALMGDWRLVDKTGKGPMAPVMPVAIVGSDKSIFEKAKSGDVLMADLVVINYEDVTEDNIGDVIGIIYWVAPDGKSVRVLYPTPISTDVPWTTIGANIKEMVDNPFGCTEGSGGETPEAQQCKWRFDGHANTIIHGGSAMALRKAFAYYPQGIDNNDPFFGYGKWYLPSISELMALYGTDFTQVTAVAGESGNKGDVLAVVNETLQRLNADVLGNKDALWSSSEVDNSKAWAMKLDTGTRIQAPKYTTVSDGLFEALVRPSLILPRSLFAELGSCDIEIGDVVYSDGSHSRGSSELQVKTPIGVVYWGDNNEVRIISLNYVDSCTWSDYEGRNTNIAEIRDIEERDVPNCKEAVTCEIAYSGQNWFNGKTNTAKWLSETGCSTEAAYMANNHSPYGNYNTNQYLGLGDWYLPAIGELMLLHGTYFDQVTSIEGETGSHGMVKDKVNEVLAKLHDNASYVQIIDNGYYWSSSLTVDPEDPGYVIGIAQSDGTRAVKRMEETYKVRPVALLDDVLEEYSMDGLNEKVRIGHVICLNHFDGHIAYVDADVGCFGILNGNFEPAGVVYWVSPDHKQVRVVSLKDVNNVLKLSNCGNRPDYTTERNIEEVPEQGCLGTVLGGNYCSISGGSGSGSVYCSVPLTVSPIFDGRDNTDAIVDALGNNALAALASWQFYPIGVPAYDLNFGQGKWYLPAIGEWMDAYGEYSSNDITSGNVTNLDKRNTINDTLYTLGDNGVTGSEALKAAYWSSTAKNNSGYYYIVKESGVVSDEGYDTKNIGVRPFAFLEGKFADKQTKPQVGDVMYSDLSYGAVANYDKTKNAVGVVVWVSNDGASARVVNLFDLAFNSFNNRDNFDPQNPDSGGYYYTNWNILGYNYTANEIDYPDVAEQYTSGDRGSCSSGGGSGGGSGSYESCDPKAQYNASNCEIPVGEAVCTDEGGNPWYSGCAVLGQLTNCTLDETPKGYTNTTTIVNTMGDDALAAKAAYTFYPPEVDAEGVLGHTWWYLADLDETTDAMSSLSEEVCLKETCTAASVYFRILKELGLGNGFEPMWGIYTSTEQYENAPRYVYKAYLDVNSKTNDTHLYITVRDGLQYEGDFGVGGAVRPFASIACSDSGEIYKGMVLYSDMSYGNVENADVAVDAGKDLVAIVWGNSDGKIKLMTVKDLTFQDKSNPGNFKPSDPFGGPENITYWSASMNVCACTNGACPVEYQYNASNCSDPRQPSGDQCGGKWNACTCKAEYQYTAQNCSGKKQPSGNQCDNKWNACTCKPEYQYTAQNCSNPTGEQCDNKWNACYETPACDDSYIYDDENCTNIGGQLDGDKCDDKYNNCIIDGCGAEYKYDDENCTNIGGQLDGDKCNDKWTECKCPENYQYNAENCVNEGGTLRGEQCGGLWTECDTCGSEFQYNEENCKNIGGELGGEQCGERWTDCIVGGCKLAEYPYDAENCEAIGGVLTGKSCEYDEGRWSDCKCPEEFKFDVETCTQEGGTVGGEQCGGLWTECNLACPVEYQYNASNCSDPREPSGDQCDGNWNACTCKTAYTYTAQNCSDPRQPSGNQCDNKWNACTCKAEYQYTAQNCSGKKQPSGNQCDNKWNACTCKPEYQYTAQNCSNPTGEQCDNKWNACYETPACDDSYIYDDENCTNIGGQLDGDKCDDKYNNCIIDGCGAEYKYDDENCTNIGGQLDGDKCNDKWTECKCPEDYKFNVENCVNEGGTLRGEQCGDMWTECDTCGSEFQYNEENCKNIGGELGGEQCGERWTECIVGGCSLAEYPYDKDNCENIGGELMGSNCGDRWSDCKCPEEFKFDVETCTQEGGTVGGEQCGGMWTECNHACPVEYQYNASNCSNPREPSGDQCDGNWNACTCKSAYQYTTSNCTNPREPSGNQCDNKWNACTCKAEYQYTAQNCSGKKQPSGQQCDNKWNACTCKPEYQYTWQNCSNPAGEQCDNKWNACYETPACDDSYVYTVEDCEKMGGTVSGKECGGKWTECNICGSEYQYDDENCTKLGGQLEGESCGGKYKECRIDGCNLAEYPYNAENCEKVGGTLSGNNCNEWYQECICPGEYQYSVEICEKMGGTVSGKECGGLWTDCKK